MRLFFRKIKKPLRHNLWHFFVKILSLFIRICPFRAFLIGSVVYTRAITYFIFKYKKHKNAGYDKVTNIINFSKHINSKLPDWLFVFKYLVQQDANRFWGTLLYENPNQLSKYVSIKNKELLEKAANSKKGAILLGMHYGPGAIRFLLKRQNIFIKTLIIKNMYQDLMKAYLSKVLKVLYFKKYYFLHDEENFLQATRSEKKLVTSLKNGIPIMMYLDFEGPYEKGITENFLGVPMRISSFPFRLALKYEVPVLLCTYEKAKGGRFNINFIPIGDFSSPEEGVSRYIKLIENRILDCPFMWYYAINYIKWVKNTHSQDIEASEQV